jgi:hypothetical protein
LFIASLHKASLPFPTTCDNSQQPRITIEKGGYILKC